MAAHPVKAAVIGAGMMGRVHALAAARAGAVVEVVADSNPSRARALAASIGSWCEAMETGELLAARRATVIHVCTPPDEHFATCTEALKIGANVICEKPVASDAQQVEALFDLARDNNVQLCPMHQFPFQRGIQRVLSSADRFGTVRHASMEICTAGGSGLSGDARHQIALDILPHPLSLFRLFAKHPLAGVEWKVSCASKGELAVTGASGELGLSVVVSTMGRPTSNSLTVIGERATATADLFHGFSVIESGNVSRLRKMSRPFVASGLTLGSAAANGLRRGLSGESDFPGLRELVRQFYEAVSGDFPGPVAPQATIDIAIARDNIISAISGTA